MFLFRFRSSVFSERSEPERGSEPFTAKDQRTKTCYPMVLPYQPPIKNVCCGFCRRTLESVDMKISANLGLLTIVLTVLLAVGACQRAPVSESNVNVNTNLSTNANL